MPEGSIPYADIIILALIAGFILLRLRNVLGQKGGNDNPDFLRRIQPQADAQEPVVRLADKIAKPAPREDDPYLAAMADAGLKETIEEIKAKDLTFTATGFLDGAKGAFEMALDAFAKGEKPPLKMLLAPPLYQELEAAVDAREKEDAVSETTLVAVMSKDLVRAALTGNTARLTVKFVSEQITVTRNRKGEIVEGDPSHTHQVEDEWTFERDVTSRNPNWKIIET